MITQHLYEIIFFILSILLAIIIIPKIDYNKNDENKLFFFTLVIFIVIFIGESFDAIFLNPLIRTIGFEIDGAGYAFISLLIILYGLIFTKSKYVIKRNVLLLAIPSIIFAIAMLTNHIFHGMAEITFLPNRFLLKPTILYELLNCYTAIICVSIFIYLIKYRFKHKEKKSITFILMGISVGTLLMLIEFIAEIYYPPLIGINRASYTFILIFLAIGVLKYNMLNSKNIGFKEFVYSADMGMIFANEEDIITEVNPQIRNFINIDGEIIGKSIKEIIKEKYYNFYKSSDKRIEYKIEDKNNENEYIYVEVYKKKIIREKINIGTIVTFSDITLTKKESLKNEAILKEIHHRIKNNLQIIISLISLDKKLNPGKTKETLNKSKTHIETMALIHEGIYNSPTLDTIQVENFIKDLVSFTKGLFPNKINVNYDIDNIELDVNKATSLGLLLTEIFVNTLKYAYPTGEGDLFISIHENENKITVITYDEGVGILESDNKKGLGLTIINLLISQIDGEVKDYPCKGVGYKIQFEK